MRKPWVENVLKLCRRERVAFFFKQWGGVHKATAGRHLNNRTYDEMPMAQTHPMPSKNVRSLCGFRVAKQERALDESFHDRQRSPLPSAGCPPWSPAFGDRVTGEVWPVQALNFIRTATR